MSGPMQPQPFGTPEPRAALLAALDEESHHEPHRFVTTHGEFFTPAPTPEDVPLGAKRCCYMNAYRLAKARPELRYVEGYANEHGFLSMVKAHAWCVDADGRVVDPSPGWGAPPLPAAMRGVVLPLDLVGPMAYEYSRGTLDDPGNVSAIAGRLVVPWP